MSGWIFSLLIWLTALSAIYFIGHINLTLVEQQYRAYQTAMHTTSAQQPIEADCQWVQPVGSTLPYEHCVSSHWGTLSLEDARKEHAQDLAIASERLAQAELSYQQWGLGQKAFAPFLQYLPDDIALHKQLVVLSDDGSSPELSTMSERLRHSQQTWGGVLQDAKQSFNEYAGHVHRTDGPWRSINQPDWLTTWQADTPTNRLEPQP